MAPARFPLRHILLLLALQLVVQWGWPWIKEYRARSQRAPPDSCEQARALWTKAAQLLAQGKLDRCRKTLLQADALCAHERQTAAPLYKAIEVAFAENPKQNPSDLLQTGLQAYRDWDFARAQALFDRGIAGLEQRTGSKVELQSESYFPDGGAVAWSTDQRLLAAKQGKEILVYGLAERRILRRLLGADSAVRALAFHPSGDLYAGTEAGTLVVWDVARGQRLTKITIGERILALAIRRDGSRIAWSQPGRTVVAELPSFRVIAERECSSFVSFSPQGSVLGAVGCDDVLINAETGTTLLTRKELRNARSIAFHTDGQRVAYALESSLRIEDLSGSLQREWQYFEQGGPCLVEFEPNSNILVSLDCTGRTLRLFDSSTGKMLSSLQVSERANTPSRGWWEPGNLSFSTHNHGWPSYLVVSLNETLSLFHASYRHSHLELYAQDDWKTIPSYGHCQESLPNLSSHPWLKHAAFNRSGEVVAVSSSERLRVIDTRSKTLWQEPGWSGEVAVSDDGSVVACATINDEIRLWEVASQRPLRSLSRHWMPVTSLAFTPDGQRLVSGSIDTRALVWDTGSGQELASAMLNPLRVIGVRFAKDTSVVEIHDEQGDEWTWHWSDKKSQPVRSTNPRGRWLESGEQPAQSWLESCAFGQKCPAFLRRSGTPLNAGGLLAARWVREDTAALAYSGGVVAFVRPSEARSLVEIELASDLPETGFVRSRDGLLEIVGSVPSQERQPPCVVGAFVFPWIVCKERFEGDHLLQRALGLALQTPRF